MRAKHVSIAWLMLFVLLVSLGLAALRSDSVNWAGAMYLATCGVLGLAMVGLVYRTGRQRAWWLGFTIFGAGYLALVFCAGYESPRLPTIGFIEWLVLDVGGPLPPLEGAADDLGGFGAGGGFPGWREAHPFRLVGHCLWSLMLACLGGSLALAFFGTLPPEEPISQASKIAQQRDRPRRWGGSWARSLGAILGIAAVATIGSRMDPDLSTGAMVLLTWGVIGVATLGAIFRPGQHRVPWVGAALFGTGYMLLIFGTSTYDPSWPHQAVDNALRSLLPWVPPLDRGYPASTFATERANARVRQMLEQPVPFHFAEKTPLGDVLAYIRRTVHGPDARGLPLYVNPIALNEAETTLQAPVVLELEDVPLKTTLPLILNQVGLVYDVRDGLLEINSQGCRDLPLIEDPLLPIGHHVLALLATFLGSVLAPLIAVPAE